MLAACESAEGEMVGQIGALTPTSASPTSVTTTTTTLPPVVTTTPDELPFVTDDSIVADDTSVSLPATDLPATDPPTTLATTTSATTAVSVEDAGADLSVTLPRRKVTTTVGAPAPVNPVAPLKPATPVRPAGTVQVVAPSPKSSWALPAQPTVAPLVTVPSDSSVIEIVDVQGISVPVLDGWVAFTTPESVALNSELADLVQRTLYAQLTQDRTKAVFIPKNELLNASPSMVVVIVRSGTGLTGPSALERLIGASVDVEAFVVKNQRPILWGGLPSGRAQLSHSDGRSRIVSAVSSEQGRLAVLQTTGNRSDLAAVHDRLLAEINPNQ